MIYLFLENGFEEIEAFAPVDLLRRAGAELATVGEGGRTVTGAHGVKVTADLGENDISLKNMDMVILPGGPGTANHEKSPMVRASLDYCAHNGKYIAAICAAPSVLGHQGLLKGHSAVCFPGYEDELGADKVLHDPVCISGKIITARGAGVAVEFALTLVKILYGARKAQEIRKSIQCIEKTSGN
ncbi:MAG: DJ-1/PfpI family protein [Oscillospiraceae bacterium]|jgi:4-methyl-5(b-hydroxyethyl)-thiazole monophosphate biosynthesis|nr:DJ-1/PfpI family protein [Oscillospiraceae bacterium]MCI2034846.1 DJ-1/PfpI family protein [Oscillospiraceae bacterium]